MRKFNLDIKNSYILKKKYITYELYKMFNQSVYNEFQILKSFSYNFYKRYYTRNIFYISKSRIRCVFTGRSRGTLSYYMMSRMVFKKLAVNGCLIGVKKAS